jgi:hypothetical protein
MAEIIDDLRSLGKLTKEYLDVKLDIAKSQAKITASDVVSTMVVIIMIASVFVGSLVILSFGLAYTIGKRLGDTAYGFYAVGAGFLVIAIVLAIMSKSFLKKYLQNEIMRKLDEDL